MTKTNHQTHETFYMKVENEKFPWWVTHQKFSIMDYVWKVLHAGPLMTNSPCRTSHETFSMMDYSRKVLHFHHSIIRHSTGNGRRLYSQLYLTVAIQKSAKLTHENFSTYTWFMKKSPFPIRYDHAGGSYDPAPRLQGAEPQPQIISYLT